VGGWEGRRVSASGRFTSALVFGGLVRGRWDGVGWCCMFGGGGGGDGWSGGGVCGGLGKGDFGWGIISSCRMSGRGVFFLDLVDLHIRKC